MSEIECFAISEQGADPDGNDDFVATDPELGMFVIADGMGGRPGGSQASRVATETFLEQMRRLDASSRLDQASLRRAIAITNSKVRSVGEINPLLAGLGTTLSAVLLDGARGKIVHIGDSRIYRFRAGKLEQLTKDHTLVAELVEGNELSLEAARQYPLRHVLSRSVGTQETVEPDIHDLDLAPHDCLILATDGLTDALSDDGLSRVMTERRSEDAETMCKAITEAAISNAPQDNVTVAVVRMTTVDSSSLDHGHKPS